MYILGISAFYHDSAACLVKDGDIIAAAQEERFSRKKHDQTFPEQAIKYCLGDAGITSSELDYVGFYEKPFLKFDRILETYFQVAPKGIRSFLKALPLWLKERLWMSDHIRKMLDYDGKIIFTEHHESHAASAFFPSPFEEAAILTIDGVGEWTTSSRALLSLRIKAISFETSLVFMGTETAPIFAAAKNMRGKAISLPSSSAMRSPLRMPICVCMAAARLSTFLENW